MCRVVIRGEYRTGEPMEATTGLHCYFKPKLSGKLHYRSLLYVYPYMWTPKLHVEVIPIHPITNPTLSEQKYVNA